MSPRVPMNDALCAELGRPRRVRALASSPRSRVWRVSLDRGQAVVKQILDKGDPGRGADDRFAREEAALRLAGRSAERRVAPALLGADPGARVLVLEHVDDLGKVDDWLPGYAEALARLHAVTGPADIGVLPAWSGPSAADTESFVRLAGALEVPVAPEVPDELAGLVGRLDPTGHHALLHGDPCPGNDLRTADGVVLIDFEQASLGNGLMELAFCRIGFPTCWCAMSVPAGALVEAEATYRATWRRLAGAEVPGDIADACAGWLIRGDALVERAHRESVDHLARVPLSDFDWGYISARERLVHRLGVVAGLSGDDGPLPTVGRLCAALRERMLHRWPTLRPLPQHPTRPW